MEDTVEIPESMAELAAMVMEIKESRLEIQDEALAVVKICFQELEVAQEALQRAIIEARRVKVAWAKIGNAVDMTGQGASSKWSSKVSSSKNERNG